MSPIVQTYGPQKVDLIPIPGVRKTAAETPDSEGAQLAQAQGQEGETIAGVGGALARLGVSEYDKQLAEARQHAENVGTLSANKARDDFEWGLVHDPVNGALATTKGKEALGLVGTVLPAFDDKVTEIAGNLNDRQRDAFLRQSLSSRESLRTTLDHYGAKQADEYEHGEYVGALGSSNKLAVANIVDNPLRAGQELARSEGIVNQFADSHGVGPAARQAMLSSMRTSVHTDAIDGLLTRGEDRNAQHYYQAFKDQIDGDQLAGIEKKLQAGTTAGDAQRAATQIWQAFAPKNDADAVQIDRMADAARTQLADDPKTLKATLDLLHERRADVDAGRAERAEANAGTVWRAVNSGASLSQVRTMDDYLALPGKTQAAISDHLVQQAQARADRSYTLSEHAYAAARRAEADKEQAGWAMRWHYDDPKVLSQMSENQVLALTPDLGAGNVDQLLKKRREYAASPEKVRQATIDDDLFKSIAESAGLHAYATAAAGTAAGEQRKAQLGQLRNTVEQAIADEQTRKKGPLTRTETQDLMRRVVDHKVMIDAWGPDSSMVAAAVVNAKDRENAYVPLAQIPAQNVGEAVNLIRSRNAREQAATRADIVARWGDRIQKAYAAKLMGLGPDEELRRLEGR